MRRWSSRWMRGTLKRRSRRSCKNTLSMQTRRKWRYDCSKRRNVLKWWVRVRGESRAVFPHIKEQLSELNLGPMRSEVPLLAVSLALEAKASQRELTSRLLADLCGPVLTCGNLESAFDKLLWELPDLVLDTPGAPQVNPPVSTVSLGAFRV